MAVTSVLNECATVAPHAGQFCGRVFATMEAALVGMIVSMSAAASHRVFGAPDDRMVAGDGLLTAVAGRGATGPGGFRSPPRSCLWN